MAITRKMGTFFFVLLLASFIHLGQCQLPQGQDPANRNAANYDFYLDKTSDCNGVIREIYDFEAVIRGDDLSSTKLGPNVCTIKLKTTSQFKGTVLEIEVIAAKILDCGSRITIYDGELPLMSFDCGSNENPNRRRFFTKGDTATFVMTRQNVHNYEYDIEIRVRASRAWPYLEALTTTECRAATDNCQAQFMQMLQQENQSSLIFCQSARSSFNCVQKLPCESEMYLRMAIRRAMTKGKDRWIQECEIGTYFPKDRNGTIECQTKRAKCMTSYVDLHLDHEYNSSTTNQVLCQDLNTFATCQMNPEICVEKKEEVVKFVDGEKARLQITNCNVDALSQATYTNPWSTLWIAGISLVVAYSS